MNAYTILFEDRVKSLLLHLAAPLRQRKPKVNRDHLVLTKVPTLNGTVRLILHKTALRTT